MYAYRLSLRQVIVERGLVAAETLARAVVVQEESGERLDAVLTRLGLVSEQALAETLAEAAGLRLAGPDDYPAAPLDATVSPRFLREAKAVPLRAGDRKSTRLNSSHRLTSRMPSSA